VGEVSLVAIASTTTFLINTYILQEKELKKYTHQFANFVGQSLTYPFQVSAIRLRENTSMSTSIMKKGKDKTKEDGRKKLKIKGVKYALEGRGG
jgi:hypothetical protein